LNDAASSEGISKNNAPIIQLPTICQNMHISYALCAKTICDSIKELKILIGDVLLYRYLIYNDLEQTVDAFRTSHDLDEILPLYKSLN
jgi:hypothetical protein